MQKILYATGVYFFTDFKYFQFTCLEVLSPNVHKTKVSRCYLQIKDTTFT